LAHAALEQMQVRIFSVQTLRHARFLCTQSFDVIPMHFAVEIALLFDARLLR
jgi:hypothetical protein